MLEIVLGCVILCGIISSSIVIKKLQDRINHLEDELQSNVDDYFFQLDDNAIMCAEIKKKGEWEVEDLEKITNVDVISLPASCFDVGTYIAVTKLEDE